MECCDELTLGLHLEGALDGDVERRVADHLSGCTLCQRRAQALAVEEASLRAALLESASDDAPVSVEAWSGWPIAAGVATVLGLSTAVELLRRPPLPDALAWVQPQGVSLGLELLASVAAALAERGAAAMPVVLAFGLVLAASALRRRRPFLAALTLLLTIGTPIPSGATELRTTTRGQKVIVVPANETIDDTLIISGDTVLVEGTVKGDLIATGGHVRLSGTTGGSLLCLARQLDVDGRVGGDVYVVATSLGARGRIERNLHMLVRRADLVAGSTVAHDVIAVAEEARLAGLVGRDVWTRTNGTQLAGTVGRNAEVTSDRVLVEGSAVITGGLSATVASARDLQIAEGAQIRGGWRVIEETARNAAWQVRGPRYVPSQFLEPGFYFWQGLLLCAALFAGALLFWLAPGCFEWQPQAATGILKAMGVGFVVLVAAPLVSLVVALTLVGLPIAGAIACAWVALVYLSGLFAAAWIGRVILRRPLSGARPFLLALLVGEVLLRIVTHLPFVDTALWLCALVFGSGLASMSLPRLWRRLRTS